MVAFQSLLLGMLQQDSSRSRNFAQTDLACLNDPMISHLSWNNGLYSISRLNFRFNGDPVIFCLRLLIKYILSGTSSSKEGIILRVSSYSIRYMNLSWTINSSSIVLEKANHSTTPSYSFNRNKDTYLCFSSRRRTSSFRPEEEKRKLYDEKRLSFPCLTQLLL
jgi:hypothetical protein